MTFTFTADASGSKDGVTLPKGTDAVNARRLRIRPPSGHAWTFAKPNAGAPEMTRDVDQELVIEQASAFREGETPLYVALDSGSGTFQASLE